MARRPRFSVATVVFGVLMAGSGGTAADEPHSPGLTGPTWRAETIMGRPVIDASASTVTFDADGRVHGRGGCNRYFGAATIDGEQESFGPLGYTKMACAEALMDHEARFFSRAPSAGASTSTVCC